MEVIDESFTASKKRNETMASECIPISYLQHGHSDDTPCRLRTPPYNPEHVHKNNYLNQSSNPSAGI